MSITKTVINVDTTAVASVTNYAPSDKSDFALIDTSIAANGGREALYQKLTDAVVDHPATVRVGYYSSKDGKKANISIKYSTWVESVDSVSGLSIFEEMACTIALSGPGTTAGLDAVASGTLMRNVFSWYFPMSGTTLGPAGIDQLKFGVVNGLHLLAD